ncbi:hypothetical protein DSO57_1022736 [Entomophthora muscae]|uniref:Uncharacterized protein n=1 Tax=Entomophthora muscae TaxID=34485 RepID=A0ACC2RU74_9FUNG|nr:hypothetical protein DSO57_1022736 [Entomophthora muscae]
MLCLLNLVLASPALAQNFTHMFAFGDSYSDYGNLFRATGHTRPDPRYYYEGRTSNGPTWIEVAASRFSANLTSFAYGGATSDNVKYTASVPGAKQQVDIEFEAYRNKDTASFDRIRNSSLIIYAFVGNDLFLPNGDAKSVVTELAESLGRLIARTQIPSVLITVSNGIRFTPFTNAIPDPQKTSIINLAEDFKLEWGRQIVVLRKNFPATTFYELHGQSFWGNFTSETIPGTSRPWKNQVSCLTPAQESELVSACPARTAFEPSVEQACASIASANLTFPNYNVCSDPDDHVFWDKIHPTAVMHRHIATHMQQVLQGDVFS